MSIYSGFATRKDESKYNGLLTKLILLMQNHILEFVQGKVGQAKALVYTKIISKMKDYEEHKYLPPKFSELLQPLCKVLGLPLTEKVTDPSVYALNQDRYQTDLVDKHSSNSLHKLNGKSKLNGYNFESQQLRRIKKCSLLQQKSGRLQNIVEGQPQKRTVFLSSADLKGRIDKGLITKEHKAITQTEQSQCSQSEDKELPFREFRTASHQNAFSKFGKNIRYKAHLALQQAQQNILKRQLPPRAQLRRKLKKEMYKDQSVA